MTTYSLSPVGTRFGGKNNSINNIWDMYLYSLTAFDANQNYSESTSSILDSGKYLANLFKRRCGVGLDISLLRPEGTPVKNSAGTTSGAWSFADYYSYVCRMIGQNGRRGALMISMDIRHPDIENFALMKNDLIITNTSCAFFS